MKYSTIALTGFFLAASLHATAATTTTAPATPLPAAGAKTASPAATPPPLPPDSIPPKVTPAQLKALENSLDQEFNGTFVNEQDGNGTATAATLADGTQVFELEGDIAKYAFYDIPKAREAFVYIPHTITSGWLNSFTRQSDAILCGLGSMDLKNDPFPVFKCRFSVDANGVLHAFQDQKNIPYRDDALSDFFYDQLGDKTSPVNGSDWSKVQNPQQAVTLYFHGTVAAGIYAAMTAVSEKQAVVQEGPFPAFNTTTRTGKDIMCSKSPATAQDMQQVDGLQTNCWLVLSKQGQPTPFPSN